MSFALLSNSQSFWNILGTCCIILEVHIQTHAIEAGFQPKVLLPCKDCLPQTSILGTNCHFMGAISGRKVAEGERVRHHHPENTSSEHDPVPYYHPVAIFFHKQHHSVLKNVSLLVLMFTY